MAHVCVFFFIVFFVFDCVCEHMYMFARACARACVVCVCARMMSAHTVVSFSMPWDMQAHTHAHHTCALSRTYTPHAHHMRTSCMRRMGFSSYRSDGIHNALVKLCGDDVAFFERRLEWKLVSVATSPSSDL